MSALPIEITQFVLRYPKASADAVQGLDLTLARGEILGLLGPNGAGKTTTLHAVLGLLTPTTGEVRVFGCSPTAQRLRILPRINFASIDVDPPSNLTVREFLTIFARLYGVARPRPVIDELLERFEITPLHRQTIATLSNGERMRLKLCKALLNSPELLVLDEPTLSLDPYMAHKVRETLKTIQRRRGLAVLHTSHNMQEVEAFCDRIVFLHRGRMLAEGPPAEIVARFKSRSLDELFIRAAASGELFAWEA